MERSLLSIHDLHVSFHSRRVTVNNAQGEIENDEWMKLPF